VSTPEQEYRIDDLADRSLLSVRNIREYQDRGLLPPPRRRGRVAYYSDDHLARLELISHLLSRGYTLATIRDLFEAWEKGRDLRAVLGLESAIGGHWLTNNVIGTSDIEPFEVPGYQLSGEEIQQLIDAGAVTETDGDLYMSRGLRQVLIEVLDAGIPVEVGAVLLSRSRTRLTEVAEDMVSGVFDVLLPEGLPAGLPEGDALFHLTNSVQRLIPVAEAVTRLLFGEALRNALDEVVHQVTTRALESQNEQAAESE
jgi:DNA-binding transcriptional MerR regulator